jgi:hypothetical protein
VTRAVLDTTMKGQIIGIDLRVEDLARRGLPIPLDGRIAAGSWARLASVVAVSAGRGGLVAPEPLGAWMLAAAGLSVRR